MKDNFDLYDWNNKRRLAENNLASISDMVSVNDKRVNAVHKAILKQFVNDKEYLYLNDNMLRGIIRNALADFIEENLGLDVDQNINKDDEGSSFNITRGGDDPKIGAEEESDANVVGENKSHLKSLSKYFTSMHPDLRFEVSNFDDIRVYGSQGDLMKFGNEMHGKKFGEYEVFHVDDDDQGEIVRIVKSDSIMRG